MIGFLKGQVVHCDGDEIILLTDSGVGHQISFPKILREGLEKELFITAIYRENDQRLYGFEKLQDKKTFETLLKVKGVGPKGAFSLIWSLGVQQICHAIHTQDKKTLTKAPGIGTKAAAQIILDLEGKTQALVPVEQTLALGDESTELVTDPIFEEALMAFKELGYKKEKVINLARKVRDEFDIKKPEQLVQLVLQQL